ncbi:class I SAM-dependent methyltransferase [Candidatus Gottesmanbacteria bacterium]|nr:class I SAM-dependent methyltransferase [Candidatus Gottesmanbacteria bacterium]
MQILIAAPWSSYELLDTGDGRRLERFGDIVISRPDPQILWHTKLPQSAWQKADAVFENGWHCGARVPDRWRLSWKHLSFWAKLTPFKHTGVFPEQASHWEWMQSILEKGHRPVRVLNLFAYTGIASLVAATAGATVTHVDASKPSISWAKENSLASHIPGDRIRWIVDDALSFVVREVRRGSRYDAVIMDPPVYGHGPKGGAWDMMKDFPRLVSLCRKALSDRPVFVLVNAYAVSASSLMLANVLEEMMAEFRGRVEAGELAIQEASAGRLLSTGIFARWRA